MAKKIQKLKPDTVLKNYWRSNERFADFFNAVLFEGKPVIKPDELEDEDTEESSVLENGKYAEAIQASRDNIKIRKKSKVHGVEFVMLGLEHQEHIHYAMPMRVMGYDYGVYKKQYDKNSEQYKTAEGMEEDEYLSRMKKTDKFRAVITVVVYYGEKRWDGAASLHEMLDIPEEMKKYVNDYK
ncbi:MAG: Rpn family recombination-promoting nuclease/putative transposase, partial [Lachnospiraceae bacterium]|nr:Rpn family recombination-promoting nuclease/putative transposase [Lachnospiraceae bacterium]